MLLVRALLFGVAIATLAACNTAPEARGPEQVPSAVVSRMTAAPCAGYFPHPLRRNHGTTTLNRIVSSLYVNQHQGIVGLDDGSSRHRDHATVPHAYA